MAEKQKPDPKVAEGPMDEKLCEALKRVAELEEKLKKPPAEDEETSGEECDVEEPEEATITTPDGKVVPYTEIMWYKS